MSGLMGMEQALVEYAANAVWQLPVLTAGAWLLVRVAKPGVAAQHRIWLGVLALAVLLPLCGAFPGTGDMADVVAVTPARAGAAEQAVSLSPNVFSAGSFDQMGEPGGLILGGRLSEPQSALGGAIGATISRLKFVAHARCVRLNATAAGWLTGLYLTAMLFGLLRLALAWSMARRLVRHAREISLTSRERLFMENCAQRLGVRMPEVRESVEIAGPVVVGATRPVLLWPEGFAGGLFTRQNEDEVMAALCHEMAHIRRRDYGKNLLCMAAAVPIKWHPVTYGVERQIRNAREMACDAMAAKAMESEMRYAKCLLRLAESMVVSRMTEQAGALGLFNGNALEERVMRLMQEKTTMSVRARVVRGVTGAAAMLAMVALAAAFHVVPALAQAAPAVGDQTAVAPAAITPNASAVPAEAAPLPTAALLPAVAALPTLPPLPALAPVPAVAAPLTQAVPAVEPAPEAVPAPVVKRNTQHVHPLKTMDGKSFSWVNGQERELTPAERARVEAQLAEAQKKIAAETAKLNNPEFRKQIEEAQRKAMEAEQKLNSGEFQKQMADAQKQVAEATARMNSPEFREQLEKAQRDAIEAEQKLNSGEFQKQMTDAQKQVAEATARMNSPEFREQLEKAQRKAIEAEQKLNSGEFQKQMADAQKQVADALAKMKAEQAADTQKR